MGRVELFFFLCFQPRLVHTVPLMFQVKIKRIFMTLYTAVSRQHSPVVLSHMFIIFCTNLQKKQQLKLLIECIGVKKIKTQYLLFKWRAEAESSNTRNYSVQLYRREVPQNCTEMQYLSRCTLSLFHHYKISCYCHKMQFSESKKHLT